MMNKGKHELLWTNQVRFLALLHMYFVCQVFARVDNKCEQTGICAFHLPFGPFLQQLQWYQGVLADPAKSKCKRSQTINHQETF